MQWLRPQSLEPDCLGSLSAVPHAGCGLDRLLDLSLPQFLHLENGSNNNNTNNSNNN